MLRGISVATGRSANQRAHAWPDARRRLVGPRRRRGCKRSHAVFFCSQPRTEPAIAPILVFFSHGHPRPFILLPTMFILEPRYNFLGLVLHTSARLASAHAPRYPRNNPAQLWKRQCEKRRHFGAACFLALYSGAELTKCEKAKGAKTPTRTSH